MDCTKCIYRSCSHGRCTKRCNEGMMKCNVHKGKNLDTEKLHALLDDMDDRLSSRDLQELYTCCGPELIADAIFGLFDTKTLFEIANTLSTPKCQKKSTKKRVLAQEIADVVQRIGEAFSKPSTIAALKKLQIVKLVTLPSTVNDVNDTDIFTLEPITSLSESSIFRYTDYGGKTYAFSAPELEYSVRNIGPYNPYTRERIPRHDILRLASMMGTSVTRIPTPLPEDLWKTCGDAYTDVLYYYEALGFRSQVEWFANLKPTHIFEIFYGFHANIAVAEDVTFFDLNKIDRSVARTPLDLHFVLAKAMLELVQAKTHPMQFYYICNFFLSAARVSRNIYRSLPTWLLTGAVAA